MNFKINHLPEKYEDIILPLMTVNPKLVLGGSLALHILDIMDYDFTNRKPDLDFSLLEPLTEEELASIKDFFNLQYKIGHNDYDIVVDIVVENVDEELNRKYRKIKSLKHFLEKELIQLSKLNDIGDIDYTIDFFNSSYLPKKEHLIINYNGFDLKLTHPSYILSHKSKYAYDSRVGKQHKHFQDLQQIDWKKYFQIVKRFHAKWEQEEGKPFQHISHYYISDEVIAGKKLDEQLSF